MKWRSLWPFRHRHKLYAAFDGARQGKPCHWNDGGECVYTVYCSGCGASDLYGGNEIRQLLLEGYRIHGVFLEMGNRWLFDVEAQRNA